MKKRVFLTAILSLVMCSNSIYAFDGPTHTYVTAKALEIFEKAHGTKYSEIFTPRNKAIILEYIALCQIKMKQMMHIVSTFLI